jgi:hypothetical protein
VSVGTRPVVPGFHPDPSVCVVDGVYLMACSSFEYAPGIPLFRSTDLRTWEPAGHVLDRPEQLVVTDAGPAGGVFAPTLRHHDGRWWMATTNWTDEGGQLISWATDPAGPWSVPARIPGAVGIDPDLAWTDDGTCLMTYAGFGALGGIVQSAIDPGTGEVLTEPVRIWNGTGGKFPEGPHLYRVGEHWYLLIAEGGTERGHAVTVARSASPSGPFEACPTGPVLTHRGTDHPVQNTGHADLVHRPDGSWAMVFHGVRARGASPQWHVLGRETFAVEIDWVDGWPAVAGPVEPAGPVDAVLTRELTGPELGPEWVAAEQFPEELATWSDEGWVVGPGFLGARQEQLFCEVTADLEVRGTGGLALRIDPRHGLALEVDGGRVSAVWSVDDVRHTLGSRDLAAGDRLRIVTSPGTEPRPFSTALGPDRVTAGVVTAGGFEPLGSIDGRYVSTEVAGGMTGRMAGITCSAGHVLVRSLVHRGCDVAEGLA